MFTLAARKAVLLAGCVILLAAAPASAERGKSPKAGPRVGRYALQFQLDDNFKLSDFQGAVLSAKYHRSAQSAVRLGLDFDAESEEGKQTTAGEDSASVAERQEFETARLEFKVVAQYVRHSNPGRTVSYYRGGGPFVGFRRHKLLTDSSEQEETRWSAGLEGVWGAEWALNRSISLLAEYGIAAGYFSSSREAGRDAHPDLTSESTGLQVKAGPVRFGISVYF